MTSVRGVGDRDLLRAAGLLALLVFAVLLVSGRSVDLLGSPTRIGLIVAWPAVAVAFWVWSRMSVVVAYLIAGGLILRWVEFPTGGVGGSDVLAAINEALGVWGSGGNPYDHVYGQTRPPGQPMPYPPGALLLHLPGHLLGGLVGVQFTQFVLGGAVMAGLAWAAARFSWLVGLPALGLYAAAPNLVLVATDGSNDTATGAMLLLAIAVLGWSLERRDQVSALSAGAAMGLAVSTKQLALPIAVAVASYAVQRYDRRTAIAYLFGAGWLLLVISLPFLLMGPGDYLSGLLAFIGVHEDIYGWNVWALVQGLGWTPFDRDAATALTAVVGVVALAALVALRWRSLGGAVLGGVVATLVVMLAARWTTYAYFGMLLPVALAIPLLVAWERRSLEEPA
jgi:hypothetical protein